MKSDTAKPFLDHLEELRRRLLTIVAAAALGFVLAYPFVDRVIHYLARFTGGFVYIQATEAFLVRVKIACLLGVFMATPVLIFQIWRFVGVALSPPEKRGTLLMVPISYGLFLTGAALAWFIVLPAAMKFLTGFSTPDLKPFLSIDAFVGFAGWLAVGFGAVFQLPLVVTFLARLELISSQALVRHRPTLVVGFAILAAFLTPGPDIFSQLALLIPTYLLFEVSVLIVRRLEKRRRP